MPQPLAKVLSDEAFQGPRGPDGRHEIVVPEEWLAERAWVEVPLPRLLSCISCDGGGCDRCDRSGAVTTRPRKTLAEVVEVQLPSSGAVLRIPRYGGLPPDSEPELERGLLLLTVRAGSPATEGLRKLERVAPVVPVRKAPAPQGGFTPGLFLLVAALMLMAGMAWLLSR